MRATPSCSVALPIYALPHIGPAVARAESRTSWLRARVPGLLDALRALGLDPWQPEAPILPSWEFVPIMMANAEQFQRLRHSPEADELGVCAPPTVPLRDIRMLRDRAKVVGGPCPSRNLRESWVLLDPRAALRAPRALERWARGGK
jgi:perosamine synthetase